MPAPSPLKKHTDTVLRWIKEENYYYNEYQGFDAKIQAAKDAAEDEMGNKSFRVDQTIGEKLDSQKAYHVVFTDDKLPLALEKLKEELEKAGETEADEQMEREMKLAEETIEKGEKVLGNPRLPKVEERK